MTDLVRMTPHDGIALIHIDNPPVNALDANVAQALIDRLREAQRDPAVSAIVIMGAGRTFVAGADIGSLERSAWGNPREALDLRPMLAAVEDCSKPIVMAIHGTALGGGLELAMAGHFRVASADALLGQPEVNLGIIPGAEGTQRLPRLVGIAKALELCVMGKPLKAADALDAGLIDAVADDDLTSAASDLARKAKLRPIVKTRDCTAKLGTPDVNAPIFANARELAAKTRRQQIAPQKAIEAIEAATTLPFDQGCRREREIFFECVAGEQAKALIHVFFAERAVTRVRDLPNDTNSRTFKTVGVVGAGTMGAGIATACANADLAVILKDTTQAAVDAGMATIRKNFDTGVARGRMTPETAAKRLFRIRPQLTYDGFESADVIIEAVFENLALKKQIFQEIDRVAGPGAVLATNTSTLDIDEIAGATSQPDRVLGLHFFSPAHIMRLLEVVRGGRTGGATLAGSLSFGKKLGKVPVVVANCRGFVGNRMMFPYMYEAQFLVEEGATPDQVDRVLTGFGMAMGIFAVDDMAGVDVAWRVRQELGHFGEPGSRKPLVADKLYEQGRYGQKTGAGWYRYDSQRKGSADPAVIDLIRTTAAAAGIRQRKFTDEEILARCLFALINEGARIVEDGSVERASDIDIIYVNGYGFPAWRGGPMFYADRSGLAAIHERILQFQREHGDRWKPAPLLARLAKSGGTFRELDGRHS